LLLYYFNAKFDPFFTLDCPEGKIINSRELVVGDVIEIRDKLTIPCDCILISGEIYVNEGSLSGESIPIKKIAINSEEKNCFN